MNPEEINARQQSSYEGYGGSSSYEDAATSTFGQKLGDDSSFADLLARKIKEELKPELPTAARPSHGQRLILALVSVVMLALSFIALAVALSTSSVSPSGTIALGWGMVAICVAMMVINNYFNSNEKKDESKKS